MGDKKFWCLQTSKPEHFGRPATPNAVYCVYECLSPCRRIRSVRVTNAEHHARSDWTTGFVQRITYLAEKGVQSCSAAAGTGQGIFVSSALLTALDMTTHVLIEAHRSQCTTKHGVLLKSRRPFASGWAGVCVCLAGEEFPSSGIFEALTLSAGLRREVHATSRELKF